MPSNLAVRESLIKARALIADPDNWCQGVYKDGERMCASKAVAIASGGIHNQAYDTLAKAMGVGTFGVCDFNDSHTHEEVLAAFDKAIG